MATEVCPGVHRLTVQGQTENRGCVDMTVITSSEDTQHIPTLINYLNLSRNIATSAVSNSGNDSPISTPALETVLA